MQSRNAQGRSVGVLAVLAVLAVLGGALAGCSLIKDPDATSSSGNEPSATSSGSPGSAGSAGSTGPSEPSSASPTTAPSAAPTAFDKDAVTQFPEEGVLDAATGDDVVLTLTSGDLTARSLPGLDTLYELTASDGEFTDVWTDSEAGLGYTLEVENVAGQGTGVGDDHFTVSRFDLETGEVSEVATAVVPQNAQGASLPATGHIAGVSGATVLVDSFVPDTGDAHTVLAIGLRGGRLVWRARPAQVLTSTDSAVVVDTGTPSATGAIKALEMDDGATRWSALPDTLGASAIGTTDRRVLIVRADSVFPEPSITSVSLRTGNAGPSQATDSWDWDCAATAGPVAVCTLAEVGRVVGWNVELNREAWSLPTKERFAPTVTLVQGGLVYGDLDSGAALVLDAQTGDDIAGNAGVGPFAVNNWGGVTLYSGYAYFLPARE